MNWLMSSVSIVKTPTNRLFPKRKANGQLRQYEEIEATALLGMLRWATSLFICNRYHNAELLFFLHFMLQRELYRASKRTLALKIHGGPYISQSPNKLAIHDLS